MWQSVRRTHNLSAVGPLQLIFHCPESPDHKVPTHYEPKLRCDPIAIGFVTLDSLDTTNYKVNYATLQSTISGLYDYQGTSPDTRETLQLGSMVSSKANSPFAGAVSLHFPRRGYSPIDAPHKSDWIVR
jgi:hypothetical protein